MTMPAADATYADVVVRSLGRGSALFARRAFGAGEVIFPFEGRLTERPTRTSIQISEDLHLDGPEATPTLPWQFLNHSCDPNSRVGRGRLVALVLIAVGEQITFDYNTTELEMATPFTCVCAGASCRGQLIRGFAHLTEDERTRLAPYLSPHLKRHHAETCTPRP